VLSSSEGVLEFPETMASFLFISNNDSFASQEDAAALEHKRAVRSHAMRDFRRRQREGNMLLHTFVAGVSGDPRSERIRLHATKDIPHAVEHATSNATTQSLRTSIESNATLTIPVSITSSTISRMPLLQAVVEGFFPQSVWNCRALTEGFKYWAAPRSSTMQQINDSVGLLQLGISCKNEDLILEGQRQQLLAVKLLGNELREDGICNKTASHATITLMVSEMFAAVSSGPTGHAVHLAGLTSILEAQVSRLGPHALDANVLKHYSRLILMQGLIVRQAIGARQAALTDQMSFARGTVEALLVLALRLPHILESTDDLRSKKPQDRANSDPKEILRGAVCLDEMCNHWFIDYELRQIENRRKRSDFHSFLDANALCLYWSLKLLLLECLDSLEGLAGTLEYQTSRRQRTLLSWSMQADIYANMLLNACQVMPKFNGSALSMALCIRAPLHFARSRWSRLNDRARAQQAFELETRLRSETPSFDWDVLLYWSFFPLPWLA
jgi:hypothetical protein